MENNSTPNSKNTATSTKTLKNACFLLFLAVAFGAFGAHGLEGKISYRALDTYKTGNLYHYYQSFSLILLVLISNSLGITFKWIDKLFYAGIFLFSFCCYAYAFTGIKTLALIVPLGGLSFMIGWLLLGFQILRAKR